jgi:hypothetical protein
MHTSGLIHAIDDVDGVPAMGSSHARVRTAFENRCVKVSMFLAFRAPERRGSVE